jgi:tight adherence protein B
VNRLTSILLAGLIGLASLNAAGAQEPLEVVEVVTDAHPSVSMTVNVSQQIFGAEVPPEAFAVQEGAAARPVRVERLASDDLEVILLVDTSGSMRAGNAMAAATAAAVDFVTQMPQAVQLAVVGFSSEPTVVSGFTTDHESTVAALRSLEAGGETALYDAVAVGLEQFAERPHARRAIVLLSDGGDTTSERSRDEALSLLAGTDAVLYVVELQTLESDPAALEQLASATGGRVISTTDPASLAVLYSEVASELVNRYRVTYQSESYGETAVTLRISFGGAIAEARQQVFFPAAPPPPKPEAPRRRPGEMLTLGPLAHPWLVAGAAGAVFLGLLVLLLFVFATGRPRSQLSRRRLSETGKAGGAALPALAERAATLVDERLKNRGWAGSLNAALEAGGIQLRPGEFVVVAAAGAGSAAIVGGMAAGPLGALVLGVAGALAARVLVGVKAGKRRAAFSDQLPDTLQLLSGSLRAGHALLQAVNAVAREADSPTSEEFRRTVAEARLGRDVHEALEAMQSRIGNEDFDWVVQAIGIHRDVGGDLAQILDAIADTIRDRAQIRRQISVLSAEGRLSGVILLGLPFFMAGALFVMDRGYLLELFTHPAGWFMVGLSAVLMAIGAFWIRRLVRLVF